MKSSNQIYTNPLALFVAAILCLLAARYAEHVAPDLIPTPGASPVRAGKNFKAAGDGLFEVAAPTAETKMLYQQIALASHTDYHISFDVSRISGQGILRVDFSGPNYDHSEQEFAVDLSPASAPIRVEQVINSGNAPPTATLRLFSDDPIQFAVSNLRLTYDPPQPVLFSLVALALGLLLLAAASVQFGRRYPAVGRRPAFAACALLLGAALCCLISWYTDAILPVLGPVSDRGSLTVNKSVKTLGNGAFEFAGAGTKLLSERLSLLKNTDYRVSFEVSRLVGRGTLIVDFCGPNYDNPQQEFHLALSPGAVPLRVDRLMNSANAPAAAALRVFSDDELQFTVRNLQIVHFPPVRGTVQSSCTAAGGILIAAALLHVLRRSILARTLGRKSAHA